jgi:hypothetical protein
MKRKNSLWVIMSNLLRRNALFVFPGICVGLGLWQMYRLKQKESLISVMKARLNEPPKPFDAPYTYYLIVLIQVKNDWLLLSIRAFLLRANSFMRRRCLSDHEIKADLVDKAILYTRH